MKENNIPAPVDVAEAKQIEYIFTPSSENQTAEFELSEELLIHENERRRFKKILFYGLLISSGIFYISFFILLLLVMCNSSIQTLFTSHKHLLTIIVLLIVIPSAIMWGLVRAVFRMNQDTESLAKEILKVAPQLSSKV